MQYLTFILIGLVLVSVCMPLDSFSQPSGLSKSIGIALSKNCETLIKNNYPNKCPTYEEMVNLDTSNRWISGDFVYDENGFYHRENPKRMNHFRAYDFEKEWNIFVDPPGDMRNRIRMIYLENNFDVYKVDGLSTKKGDDQTITFGMNRDIHSCYRATIDSGKWLELLPDTIYLIRNNCDIKFTKFKDTFTVEYELSEQDITTSQKYKDEQKLKWIKENCLKEYGKCK